MGEWWFFGRGEELQSQGPFIIQKHGRDTVARAPPIALPLRRSWWRDMGSARERESEGESERDGHTAKDERIIREGRRSDGGREGGKETDKERERSKGGEIGVEGRGERSGK